MRKALIARTKMRPSKKARARRQSVKVLDADARGRVFARDGHRCVRCSHPERPVQWAHIFSRRYKTLRWEEDNALALCAGCHMWWHHEPLLAVDWFRKNWPDRYERIMALRSVATTITARDLKERAAAL